MPKKVSRQSAKKTKTRASNRSTTKTVRRATASDFSAALSSTKGGSVSASSGMSSSASSMQPHSSFMQLATMFALFSIATALVLYAANLLFPGQVVLGNHLISRNMAILANSLIISLIAVGATPIIEWGRDALNYKLSDSHWMLLYFVIDTLAVWLVARFAEMLGFGIASWVVALGLGFVLDFAQGMLVKLMFSQDSTHAA